MHAAPDDPQVEKVLFAIEKLTLLIEAIYQRLDAAEGMEFARLSNSLSQATTALFNGHRTLNDLTGGLSPMEEALKELKSLDFSED